MTDEIEEVKEAIVKHEDDLVKQEEAVNKIIDDKKDKKVTENDGQSDMH